MPSYMHSDKDSSLISDELQNYLLSYNVEKSRLPPYKPRGNCQVERYNGFIRKTVNSDLSSGNFNDKQWE